MILKLLKVQFSRARCCFVFFVYLYEIRFLFDFRTNSFLFSILFTFTPDDAISKKKLNDLDCLELILYMTIVYYKMSLNLIIKSHPHITI